MADLYLNQLYHVIKKGEWYGLGQKASLGHKLDTA